MQKPCAGRIQYRCQNRPTVRRDGPGLRDSADLLERLGRDVAVRSILVDVLADLLNGSMATVRSLASALLG